MAGILSGVKVLDLSRVVSGPWSTQILADMGAEVIKIERPGAGDDTRSMGPFLVGADGEPTNNSAIYLACNRGKKSVTIDFADPRGAALLRDLVRDCDVFVENFKAGTLVRYGLDYESIKAVKPDIVYCSITGFGHDGPYSDRPAYDFIMQAMSGLMSTVGQPEGTPGSAPMRTAIPLTDMVTGLYATIGIMGALMHRMKTGEGQFVDAAMIDSAVTLNCNIGTGFLMTGRVPKRNGNTNAVVAPSDVFPTADNDIVMAVANDGQFVKLCALLEMPELATDPRFISNTTRFANSEELKAIIIPVLKTKPAALWVAAFSRANVPAGQINHMHEVFADPQVRHRGIAIELAHPSGTPVRLIRNPIGLSATPMEHRVPPVLGDQTEAVLETMGVDAAARESLRAAGVI